MWRNYLTVGIRMLAHSKGYTFINILGLSVGFASCLLILLFVRHQLSYDRWLPESDRIYAVQSTMTGVTEGSLLSARTPRVAAQMLSRELPQIEEAVALTSERSLIEVAGRPRFIDLQFTDPNFFRIFDIPFVRGDPRAALSRPGNLVLTESEAARLFGRRDPLGATVTLSYRGDDKEMVVSGVIRDVPDNSHLRLGFLTPYANAMYGVSEGEAGSWSQLSGYVYVRLADGQSVNDVREAIPDIVRRNIPDDAEAHPTDLRLVPVGDIYLDHSHEGSMKPGGDRVALFAFSLIALLILTIACVNFVNLATAQTSRRAREVALRKALGAHRGQLIGQFMTEALMVTLFAILVALAIVELALPTFAELVSADLVLRYLGPDGVVVPILLLAGAVTLICGVYPALVLSRQQPGTLLRTYQGAVQGSGRIRNLLVVTQFAISIALIICTAIVYAQTSHARTADPGYDQRGLLVVENVHRAAPDTRRSFYERVRAMREVRSVARSDVAPADDQENSGQFQRPGNTRPIFLNYNSVDWGFRDALRLPLLAGRFFDEARPADDASVGYNPYGEDAEALLAGGANVVVSASAARRLGFANPADAIGQRILSPFLSRAELVPSTIIGVVGDAQYRSVRDQVRPTVYYVNSTPFTYLIARYRASDPAAFREQVEEIWRQYYPEVPFEADFARDRVSALYLTDEVRGQVFAAATFVAIAVACLGLFGLAAFNAARRTKEIGIRKVFGARSRDIVRLLVWQFCQPVLIANVIAWPVAWWLMRDWLNQFSSRIDLHPGWFVGAGALALLIAALTVTAHAIRVGRTNPIHALRYE